MATYQFSCRDQVRPRLWDQVITEKDESSDDGKTLVPGKWPSTGAARVHQWFEAPDLVWVSP